MAKKRAKKTEIIEDTFQDLDVTLNDGLEVLEEIEESQEVEEVVKVTPQKTSRAAGIYHQGQLVDIVKSQGPEYWVVFVNGRKVVALASEFEVVE